MNCITILKEKLLIQISKDSGGLSHISNLLRFSFELNNLDTNSQDKNFFQLNIGSIIKFNNEIISILNKYPNNTIVFCISHLDSRMLQFLLIIGFFYITTLKNDSKSFINLIEQIIKPKCIIQSEIQKLYQALQSIEKIRQLLWIDCNKFNIKQYAINLIQYNLSEIVPQKLYCFSSPVDDKYLTKIFQNQNYDSTNSSPQKNQLQSQLDPSQYLEVLGNLGITQIIRLNSKTYKSYKFTNFGFKHHDIYFPKNSLPTFDQIREFIQICSQKDKIAIHCTSGSGRSCLMIACFCLYKYKLESYQIINWIRLIRPGSISQLQEQFLNENEQTIQNLFIQIK
ncbi:tyrosine phosphatase (macronuclear) [Tetrahymena thermophila SB210]|uniref:protein-tyrosine-phosphatase n=1 Tax=Tetrahymena thermophila (strain SB210) TaxID=312017 RepID=W7XBY9_TETTS|nr:tyrosine phosphatase [Tetrahymena thermophila SB210]EWS71206.1 tyrosine phosphatase [Tetrahymena thermophila SB210]|eukprot:XP_012656259.1 tyrosine phosphatase [Tetrahymena thermophila SB210]